MYAVLGAVAPKLRPLVGTPKGDRLSPGAVLRPGESLLSRNGQYEAAFRKSDGKFVLFNRVIGAHDWGLWDTWDASKNAVPGTALSMDRDGRIAMRGAKGNVTWSPMQKGAPGSFLLLQDAGNLVLWGPGTTHFDPEAHGSIWSSNTYGGNIHRSTSLLSDIGKGLSNAVKAIEKVPVLGSIVDATITLTTPIALIKNVASGARLDHALVNTLKDQVHAVHEIAPYVSMVVSVVPGIGTGVAAAFAAADALASGRSIDDAVMAGIRGALPGGPLVQAGFDMATKVAKGENVGMAALETARSQLPPAAQKAFDVGLAVVTGKKIQDVLAKAVSAVAPGELQSILGAGAQALKVTKGLADAASHITDAAGKNGFQLAAGLLSKAGMNETAVKAVRQKLSGPALQGFDSALKAQEQHFAWLKNVTTQAKTLETAKQVATSAPLVAHAAQTAIAKAAPRARDPRALPLTPMGLFPARVVAAGVAGCGCSSSSTGATDGAFVAANRLLESAENGNARARAQLATLARVPHHRAARVVGVVRSWRSGLRAAQHAETHGCAVQGMTGALELPPSPIPVELLIEAGVRPGSF